MVAQTANTNIVKNRQSKRTTHIWQNQIFTSVFEKNVTSNSFKRTTKSNRNYKPSLTDAIQGARSKNGKCSQQPKIRKF